MIDRIFDIILILVSGSACLYCWLLNRRLKALQDLKKGLGASIVTLSTALSKTTVAAQEARMSASSSVEKLNSLLEDVEKSIPRIDAMLESLDRGTRRAAKETRAMQTELVDTLKPLLQEADTKAGDLSTILTQLDQYTAKLIKSAANEQRREAQQTARQKPSGPAA